MIIYFADRRMNVLGYGSTSLPDGVAVHDDKKIVAVDSGVASLSFYVSHDADNRDQVKTWAEPGNYLLRKADNETEFYTIIESENDTKSNEIDIYAEDAGLDLLNEVVGPYEADRAYTAAEYIERFTGDSGFEIGLNEISDLSRKLKWEGEQTATARVLSVATQFDNAEISYSFEIDGLRIVKKLINIHKKRGKTTQAELRLNRDIDRIKTKKTVANLATALIATGGTPEGQNTPITLNGFAYDDGDFYVSGGMVKSRNALAKWSRYLSETGDGEGHIVQTYSYDTTSQSELCNRTVAALKKICDTEINFEVDISILPDGAQIGDTVSIVDDAGKLYLSARILQLETSAANNTAVATLGDYLIKGSGISQKLEDLANEFKNIAKARTFYTWMAYADDVEGGGITLDPEGKSYLGTAVNQVVEAVDISDPSAFSWALVKGTDGTDGIDGEDGTDGVSPTVAIEKIDGTTTIVITDAEGEHEAEIKDGSDGDKGDSGIIISATAPANPIVGQLWQAASGAVIKRWDGSTWAAYYFNIANLDVEFLSAIAANLGTVLAGVIKNLNYETEGGAYFDVTNGELYISDTYLNQVALLKGRVKTFFKDRNTNEFELSMGQNELIFSKPGSPSLGKVRLGFSLPTYEGAGPNDDTYGSKGILDMFLNNTPILQTLSVYRYAKTESPWAGSGSWEVVRQGSKVTMTITSTSTVSSANTDHRLAEYAIPLGFRPTRNIYAHHNCLVAGVIDGTGTYLFGANGSTHYMSNVAVNRERHVTVTWYTADAFPDASLIVG